MKHRLFMRPLHPPEKDPTQVDDEDLELLVRADELGYSEAWIGEPFTTRWENIMAPDLFIAKALPLTQRRACHGCWICDTVALAFTPWGEGWGEG